MRAAADVVSGQIRNVKWKQDGLADNKTRTIPEIWTASTDSAELLIGWFRGEDGLRPYAISTISTCWRTATAD